MTLVLAAVSAYGQKHPKPGPSNGSPVVCTACPGFNYAGQLNAGLPVYPFATPIKAHVGRYVDSTTTSDNQGAGMRTARAGKIRVAPTQRGTAPPRLYLQVGATLSAYSMNTFFSQKLPAGMVSVASAYDTGYQYWRPTEPYEQVIKPDAFVYPESPHSGWSLSNIDSQERLFDFDFDDRGYLYAAYSILGWGIVKDDGSTSGNQLSKVSQRKDDITISVKSIVALKSGSQYWAVVTDPEGGGVSAVYDVTNPANPGPAVLYTRHNQVVRYWTRTPDASRIAFVDHNYNIQIYDTQSYVTGGQPLASFSPNNQRVFISVSYEPVSGTFWGVEKGDNLTTSSLWRFSPNGGGYSATPLNVFNGRYSPNMIQANDGYLSISGFEAAVDPIDNSQTAVYDPRIFKVSGNGDVTEVVTNDFFRNYYHFPPRNYAKPDAYANLVRGLITVKHANKLYFIYADHGLGDVYELQAGDSVTATMGNTFGTPNPRTPATSTGPFYGDVLSFSATSTTTGFNIPLTWNFGNSENAANNEKTSLTGQAVTHQYGGLVTAQQISALKTVIVRATNDSTMTDSVPVQLKVPQARLVVSGQTTPLTAAGGPIDLVAGDTFADASDGSIESHFNTWTIDGISTTGGPATVKPVGALGNHTMSFTATYGPYDPITLAPALPASYSSQIANLAYTVRPFVVRLNPAASSGNTVTFSGTARVSSDATIILPTNTKWNVTWTLKNSTGTDIQPPQTTPENIGTIPNFVITNKALITNGSQVSLSVTIPDAGLAATALPFKTMAASSVLSTPDPQISITGCANVGSTCSITATSIGGQPKDDWTYSWQLLSGTNAIHTSTSPTFSPQIGNPGTYTVSLTVTKSIFTATVTSNPITVQGQACGPLPTPGSMYVAYVGASSGCRSNNPTQPCQHGENIQIRVAGLGQNPYVPQACDTFNWNFGDGTTGTGSPTNHVFTAIAQANVSVTVANTHGTSQPFSVVIPFSGGINTCTAPTGVTFSYSGSLGCGPNTPCKTGETITFTANRTGGMQSCDNVTWTWGDGSTGAGSTAIKSYSTPNTYTISVNVLNEKGQQSSGTVAVVVTQATENPGGCTAPPAQRINFTWLGSQSGCTPTNNVACTRGEAIQFTANGFSFQFRPCDKFEWNFGDGSTDTVQNPSHVFAGSNASYTVTLRVYNEGGSTNPNITRDVTFSGAPAKPTPLVSFQSGPVTVGKNTVATFVAVSDLPNTTGWSWNFGDGDVDNSQNASISQISLMQHTFKNPGTYHVVVTARNSESPASATKGTATREVTVVSTPEHRYLLPVITHAAGLNNSVWRTDVQVFNSDPNVSATKPLVLNVTFKGQTRQINVTSSTFIDEDFMRHFTTGTDSGPMIVSVQTDHRPEIWTRTYNQAAGGTFGQFIPAILLTDATAATALPSTETFQFLPGIRSGGRYRTNIGFVNPMDRELTITVAAYDDKNSRIGSIEKKVAPFNLEQFNVASIAGLPANKAFTLRITVPANAWIIAYGSMIDAESNDPTYIGAVHEGELASEDWKDLLVPGVGHTGPWRSDVTIFNADADEVVVDLSYYDTTGALKAEAKGLPIKAREFMQLDDLLRAGVLVPQPADGTGVLRVKTVSNWSKKFPLSYSRTYNDNGVATFGQGIPAFSAARANVKPGRAAIIPAVRNDDNYYTNLGLVNVSGQAIKVKVTLLRADTGADKASITYDLAPYQSTIGQIIDTLDATAKRGTLRVEIVGSNTGAAWAFASVIDRKTKDPEYIAGVPTP